MSKPRFSKEDRLRILEEAKEFGVDAICETYGIHRSTYYNWRKRYEEKGEKGLETIPNEALKRRELEEWKVEAVVKEMERNPGYGPSQIVNQLRRQRIAISIRTVTEIMRGHGYRSAEQARPKGRTRFEASRPLELAQIDILEFYIHKEKVYLGLLLDDFSRFLLGWKLVESGTALAMKELVEDAIFRYGKMETVLADRGSVFFSWHGLTRFEQYLAEARVLMTHASPGHPQTLGKIESVNKAIQKELLRQKMMGSVSEAEEEIGRWVEGYNYHRTHQGLGGLLVPADRFHGRAEPAERAVLEGVCQSLGLGGLSWPVEFEAGTLGQRTAAVFQLCLGPEGLEVWLMGQRLWPQPVAKEETP